MVQCVVGLLGNSQSTERLTLKVSAVPSLKAPCASFLTADVSLTFFNNTAPTCGHMKLEKLCFPGSDKNPHIKENRMPGALRQLRRFTHADLCPNYTISYRVETGTIKNTYGLQALLHIIPKYKLKSLTFIICVD